jgi:hypothetical protein
VTVVSDHGPPQTEWKFGVLAVDVAQRADNVIISASGIGLITTPSGTTLGYANARIVRIGDECRLVIQVHDGADAGRDKELARLLKSIPHACRA